MGALIQLPKHQVSRREGRGVVLTWDRAAPVSVHLLVLNPAVPVYQYSGGGLRWADLADDTVIEPGVYELSGRRFSRSWLQVDEDDARFVTECAALQLLGAGQRLVELGLHDAAISLAVGELTNARYQWLRSREGH